jgi:predicted Fe-Mo cluster-binding NifX family protein
MRLVTANQATAAKRRVYFHLVDVTDGITAETGEAGGQPQVSTNGGAWTNTGIGTLTSIGNGRYYADLTQTLVATTGDVIETRYKSANTAECPGDSVQVVAIDVDNAVTLGLSSLPSATAGALNGLPLSADTAGRVDVIKINGTSQTARDIGASVLLSSGTGTGQVNLALGRVGINWGDVTNQSTTVALTNTSIASVSGAVGSVTGSVGSVTGNVTVGGYAAGQAPLQPTVAGRTLDVTTTGEAGIDWANIGSPTSTVDLSGTTISTAQVVASVTGSVGSVTGNVGGNVVGSVASVTGNVGGNVVGSVASVTGNVGGNVVGSVASVTGNVGGNVVGSVASVTGNVGGNVTGSVGSILNPASIWDALTSGLTTVGSIGKLLVDNINATISSRSSHTAADVWSVATRTLTSLGSLATDVWSVATRTLTSGTNIVLAKGTGVTGFNDLDAAGVRSAVGLASANLDTQLDALPTALENAIAVWDEDAADHLVLGTTGKKLNDLSSGADPWATAVPGSYSAGTAGYILGTNLNATISSRLASSAITLNSGAVTVGSINNDVITASSIAIDAIDASAIAADAVVEIQSGLSTLNANDVWSAATRTLTSGANIALAKGVGVTGFNDLDAAGVRSAVGLASANLDTQLAALPSAATTASAVWEEPMASHTGSTTYGGRIPRAANSNVTVQITGSNHISADIHDLQPAVINNTHFAAGAIDSNALAANAAQEIADTLLGRNIAGGSSTGRTVTEALRFLRNKFAIVGTTLTVYREDDTTASWTATVGTTAYADPITSSDPS